MAHPETANNSQSHSASTAIWFRDPLAILAEGAERGIVIAGTEIVELVGPGREPTASYDRVFGAAAHVILPGLINAHHHFYQTLTRAFGPALDQPLFPWLTALYPVWARLQPEQLRLAARLAICELLLSGCTTTVDHHYVFPDGLKDAVDIEAETARDLGIRAVLTRGSMSLSEEDGGLPPRTIVEEEDRILAESERLAGQWHETGPGAAIQIALAPCSPFSVTKSLMRETAALAERLDLRLHTHLAETEDETTFCLEAFGCRPLDYLEDVGWLTDRTWLAHGIHFNENEIARLGAAGTGIAHCPSSNMILASGTAPVPALEAAGAPVGLGVDGSASADASNMIQEVRLAFQLQRLKHGAEAVSHNDALRWATAGSARCLGRADIGTIAPGLQADLAFFGLDEPRFSGFDDPLAALVLCGAHRADRVMVGGRWIVEDGAIAGVDLGALMAEHQHAARDLQTA
ncbi:MAG TPA: 8-oxoguanine deaminase [Alphaproteobacteria bacterium]|nr:8-oxoguanine deaminase [Alphaproteobacteria bacterium]